MSRKLIRNARIAHSFGARAGGYDVHAGLQAEVAGRLAGLLPKHEAPSVLEVGCGTGFLTTHLLETYRLGEFLITDLTPEMLNVCKRRIGPRDGVRFALMDGELPTRDRRFDIIAMSMTLQWFAEPLAGLECLRGMLRPGGALLYSTPGPANFPEWRAVLASEGLPDGTVDMPPLPGILHTENRTLGYTDGRAFLTAMKAIGAGEPRRGYTPLSAGSLRRALRRLTHEHDARVTWQIVYGRLNADT